MRVPKGRASELSFQLASPRPRRSHRNLRKGPSGLADEISFEDFLTIMAYFQPIDTAMDEEQVQLCRREKLRCAHPLQRAGWGGVPRAWGGRPQ